MFYLRFFFYFRKNEQIAHFLFFGERCEWIAHFAQIKWAMWANRSFRSPKMSDHERFAQVAQRKWAIVSESLRSLTKNERMSESLIFWVNRSFAHFLTKTSDSLGNQMSECPALTECTLYEPITGHGRCHFLVKDDSWNNTVAIYIKLFINDATIPSVSYFNFVVQSL